MAILGAGYGSECHLLRYLGRHRRVFDTRVGEAIGGELVEWLDFHFDPSQVWPDGERKGLDFVDDAAVQAAWSAWWPQGRGIHNWDAVGRYRVGDETGWLLVEAKANLEELESDCQAKERGGRGQIEAVLAPVKQALGGARPTQRAGRPRSRGSRRISAFRPRLRSAGASTSSICRWCSGREPEAWSPRAPAHVRNRFGVAARCTCRLLGVGGKLEVCPPPTAP